MSGDGKLGGAPLESGTREELSIRGRGRYGVRKMCVSGCPGPGLCESDLLQGPKTPPLDVRSGSQGTMQHKVEEGRTGPDYTKLKKGKIFKEPLVNTVMDCVFRL